MAAIKTLCLTSLFLIVSRISALQTGNASKTACESSNATIDFIFNIGNDGFADRLWHKNSIIRANRIARVIGAGSLTVESQYSGRIALSGVGGIILYNVTKTDSGSYLFIIVTDIYSEDGTATTTLNVYVNPNASCTPKIEKNSADSFTCKISDACPGKDSIEAIWDDGSVGVFTCPSITKNTNYKCCAKGDPVTYCNSGEYCTYIECNDSDGPDDINVSLSPRNTSYQLIEMSRLDVKCSATCFPQCNFQWSGPLVSQNNTTGLLSIPQISRNQTGTFTCTVTNSMISGKPATANFSVIVYYGPNTNGLTLSPSNTSYQLTELSPLIVNCSASCVPQCNYQWMGPGITQNDSRGLLSISHISRNQTGMFACIVNNPMIPGKSVTANFSVTVYYGPDAPLTIYPATTSYRDIEGTFITNMTCSADCNPPCNYQWIGPLGATSSGVLSLGTYDRIKRGSYFCMATNPRTSTASNGSTIDMVVIYGPDIPYMSPSTTLYTNLEGESVPDINCSADCFPGCTQVWMKGSSSVQESNGKTLSLRQVTREKAGDYTCWFNNNESRATGNISIKLIVQYPPVLTMKATNTSNGRRVIIKCTANGVPDNYTFYKLTHMAPDVSRTIVRELELTRVSNREVSFTIEKVTYQDTGFYVCKASNGITHFITGELVMEDMVSVWITNLPVITSDAQHFDAEEGQIGHMYIEFYSGLFQPLVTWYIDKNCSMELLQNSSHFRIYLSAVTVGLEYYQKTLQLPGYSASLEVIDVDKEQFSSYKVEINNSFAESVFLTLQLKPRGPPETPTNLSVVPDSVTTHSLQLIWQVGFHGGASQTFVIEYREAGKTNWLNKTESKGLVQYVSLNTSITDLKDGTTYEFRIYSENSFNRSQVSSTVNETTRTVIAPDSSSTFSLPAVAGGIGAGVVVILVAVVDLFLWRRYHHHSQHTDDITLEENRFANTRPPDNDSYEKLHPYTNTVIQMYTSLKIPKISKDSEKMYENTQIKATNFNC